MHPILFLIIFLISNANASAPQIQLANIYRDDIVITDYFVSEKLDGVRGYWTGEKFISRQGNEIHAPKWFTKDFPNEILDGELWIARGQFEATSSIVRQEIPNDADWQKISFMIFDMPKNPDIFSKRFAAMKKLKSEHLKVIDQFKVESHEALIILLENTVKNGGEGLVLHRANSFYKAERNDDLLKLKTFEDAEARVISYVEGEGKYRGMLGALLVENDDKIRFKIGGGFSDQQRKNPPKIGAIITYKFFGKTKNNTPRFASFMRVRDEI
ncbi:MAG: DNA ligase [Pseudomonadota bacterium]